MRGKQTDPLKLKAVRLLVGQMEPLEISKALGLPKRTVYDLLRKVHEQIALEEAERQRAEDEELVRQERERQERAEWEARVLSRVAQSQERVSQPVGSFGGRRFRS